MRDGLPRFAELDAAAVARACIVVLHDPTYDIHEQIAWSVSLVDISGTPLARETVVEDVLPRPLGDLVGPRLEVIARRIDGEWISSHDLEGRPKHYARVATWLR